MTMNCNVLEKNKTKILGKASDIQIKCRVLLIVM